MCGRYSLTVDKKTLAEEFHIDLGKLKRWVSRYNIAPSTPVPVLYREREEENNFDYFLWGLIPSWAKDKEIGHRMMNARKETLSEKPSFRGPFRHQRCLILSDGFYEWHRGGRSKVPYYIRLQSKKPFSFAGLWSRWRGPTGDEVRTCTIITGEPNSVIAPIHNRMPVILLPEHRDKWMDTERENTEELIDLLKPYPAEEMEAYPVSSFVNSPNNDTRECIQAAGSLL
ncbi:MAG: SOS response-associated peptidase [Candidatus Omnitrophica bacterium]|nr:SOS response-associated peptidase [Candidatus Omnitrophota bacterium]